MGRAVCGKEDSSLAGYGDVNPYIVMSYDVTVETEAESWRRLFFPKHVAESNSKSVTGLQKAVL